MAYFKDPISIGDLLGKTIHKAVGPKTAEGLDAMQVINTWHEVLGPVMSRYSINESFSKGALTVRIRSSVLRNDLFLQRTKLIESLNERIGRKLVYAIVFR